MNKIALVTGASKGIGKAIALRLKKEHIQVIGTSTTEKGAQEITQFLEGSGEGRILNLAKLDSLEKFAKDLLQTYPELNILINNAGITEDNLLLRMPNSSWDEVIKINLTAPALLTKFLLKKILKNKFGRIINITSVVGFTGNPGQTNYASSKAGIIGFTKSLAVELAARNITVNTIAPGFIATDMTAKLTDEQSNSILEKIPLKRLGLPEDIANAVNFLISEESNYITGTTIHVNGGLYMN